MSAESASIARGRPAVDARPGAEEAARGPHAGVWPSALRIALLLAAALPLLAFVLTGLGRRLNFDESLALRAGWLLLGGHAAEPPFAMPFTLGVGALGHAIGDPGLLFPLLRGLVLAGVIAAGAFALGRSGLRGPAVPIAVALCLLQPAFGVYAYEFRYDAALLVAWLAAYGWLVRRTPADCAALGATVAWLAVHHVKGAYFALCLYAICWGALRWLPTRGVPAHDERRAAWRALHLGFGGALGVWLVLCLALGIAGDFLRVYGDFFVLAADQPRVWVWSALGDRFVRDGLWWGVALAGGAITARRLARDGAWRRPEARGAVLALAFSLAPLLFLLVHPRPWPYMLALPAPFLALLAAGAAVDAWRHAPAATRAAALAGLIVCASAIQLASGIWPGLHFAVARHAPLAHQIETLRALRAHASPSERIVDPSGLAWFQPPCSEQWYVDALFHARVQRGDWMQSLAAHPASACPWLLRTYRLEMLPEAWRVGPVAGYAPVGGGLLLDAHDPRLAILASRLSSPDDELRSFWW